MQQILITPTYFPSIAHFVAIVKAEEVWIETQEHYQKQSYRNSCYINTDKGREALTIPIVYSQKNGHIRSEMIPLVTASNWQKQHLRALETAYNSSPFFEFYIDDLMPIFTTKFTQLQALNIAILKLLFSILEIDKKIIATTQYDQYPKALDLRYLANRRKEKTYAFDKYIQVFGAFESNLSILDLLFMEGPNAILYLEQQQLT